MNLRLQAEELLFEIEHTMFPNTRDASVLPKILAAFEKVRNEALEEAAKVATFSWPGSTPGDIRALKEPSEERAIQPEGEK